MDENDEWFGLLAVAALLLALLVTAVPVVQKFREARGRVWCGNSLKQIGIATGSVPPSPSTASEEKPK